MNEAQLAKILSHDYSIGTERFRDELLVRCLDNLDADPYAVELNEFELDLLSAAGNPFAGRFGSAGGQDG